MHKNLIWQAFLILVFIVTLVYTGIAAYRYYGYSRLTTQTDLDSMHWNIQEKSSDSFIVEGDYTFIVNNHPYSGKTVMSDRSYLNRYGAEEGIKEYSSEKLKVWYDAANPNYSSLEKNFPFKECLSAAFLWILFIYFLWLGFYVAKFKY